MYSNYDLVGDIVNLAFLRGVFIETYRRVVNAQTGIALQLEEFQSYLVEAYAAQPKTLSEAVQKAVRDLIALIRATLMRYGFQFDSFIVADLAALAKTSLNTTQNNVQGTLNKAAQFSVDTPEYLRQYDEIKAKYWNKDGSEKPGAMLAPNGEKSNLNKTQWIQVRTPSFRRWFGNWNYDEKAQVNIIEAKDLPSHVDYKSAVSVRKWLLSIGQLKTPAKTKTQALPLILRQRICRHH